MAKAKNEVPTTNAELAALFNAQKDDLSGWKDKPKKIRFRRGGASTAISVRLTTDELRSIQEAADEQDLTLSAFIREAAVEKAGLKTSSN